MVSPSTPRKCDWCREGGSELTVALVVVPALLLRGHLARLSRRVHITFPLGTVERRAGLVRVRVLLPVEFHGASLEKVLGLHVVALVLVLVEPSPELDGVGAVELLVGTTEPKPKSQKIKGRRGASQAK